MLCETISKRVLFERLKLIDSKSSSELHKRVYSFWVEHYILLVNVAQVESFFAPRFFAIKEMWNSLFF